MVQTSILSSNAKNIIGNYYKAVTDKNRFADNVYKRLLVSLYAVREDANNSVVVALHDYCFDLSKYFTEEEVLSLQNEYKSVAWYCYENGDMYFSKDTTRQRSRGYIRSNMDFTTPKSIVELCLKLAECKTGDEVFLPFAGLASFALNQKVECHYDTEELYVPVWAYSKILLDSQNIDANIQCKDSLFSNDQSAMQKGARKKYDYIFSFPPILPMRDSRTIVSAFIDYAEGALKENGEMYCVLPCNFCTASQGWYEFRKALLHDKKPTYSILVITLPAIFEPYSSAKMCIVVVKKDNQGLVCLADASGDNFLSTNNIEGWKEKQLKVNSIIETIEQHDEEYVWVGRVPNLVDSFNLLPTRYLVENVIPIPRNGEEKLVKLQDVIDFLPRVCRNQHRTDVPFVTVKDLSEDFLDCLIKPQTMCREGQSASLQTENCFLLAYSWGKFKVGKLQGVSSHAPVALSLNVFPFKVKDGVITEEYLLRCLLSEEVGKQAKMMSDGCVVPNLSKGAIEEISIILPSIERQNAITKQDAINSKSEAKVKLQQAFVDYKREIRTRKHALSQSVSAISSKWNTLMSAVRRNGGNLCLDDTIGRVNPINVSTLLDAMTYSLKSLSIQTEYLADVDYDWSNLEKVEPSAFLRSYIDKQQNPDMEICLSCPMADDKVISMNIPVSLVERVFDNIIANAKAHGFKDGSSPKHEIHFEWSFDGDNVCISVSNNGLPFKEGVDTNMVLTYGYSTSLHEGNHAGIGGADIKNIMEHLGSVEVRSTPTDEFPVTYVLKFNNVDVAEEGENDEK